MDSIRDEVETGPGLVEAVWRHRVLVALATLVARAAGFAA